MLYHGVSSIKSNGIENYALKHIDQESFYNQMTFLKKKCNVLSIEELLELIKLNDTPRKNSVLITFDDGYENNFSVAAPILDELNLPATFYISTGLIDSSMMFWTDILEDCFNRTTVTSFDLKLGKKIIKLRLNNFLEKIKSLQLVKKYCKSCSKNEKDEIVDSIILSTKIKPSEHSSLNYKKLNWKQIKKMDSNHLFTIGGHSTYHDILSLQSIENAKKDINLSIDLLEYNLQRKVFDYSYPEGQRNHYNKKIKDFLKKKKIRFCPSAITGVNKFNDNLFDLKRIMVGFWNLPFPFFDKNLGK